MHGSIQCQFSSMGPISALVDPLGQAPARRSGCFQTKLTNPQRATRIWEEPQWRGRNSDTIGARSGKCNTSPEHAALSAVGRRPPLGMDNGSLHHLQQVLHLCGSETPKLNQNRVSCFFSQILAVCHLREQNLAANEKQNCFTLARKNGGVGRRFVGLEHRCISNLFVFFLKKITCGEIR